MNNRLIAVTCFCVCVSLVHAQSEDSLLTRAIAASVTLDSIVIQASKSDFEVEDFVRLVKEDESLHRAFHNLREVSCQFTSEMQFVDKKNKVKAELNGSYIQSYNSFCRKLDLREEVVKGNYYKGSKKKNRYYTSALYERVFITEGEVCITPNSSIDRKDSDGVDGHIDELKKLIFYPGSKADVPFIGSKTELFSEKMWRYYDFSIKSDTFANTPVYVFEANVKKEFINKEDKTVFKTLTTYFSKTDFQVLSRTYRLAYNHMLFTFDVTMHVDLTRINGLYYPSFVRYDGTWNIPTKKKETGFFIVTFDSFEN